MIQSQYGIQTYLYNNDIWYCQSTVQQYSYSTYQEKCMEFMLKCFVAVGYQLILPLHHNDIKMSAMASQITCLTIADSTIYSGADQRKYQSSVTGLCGDQWIHRTKGQLLSKCFHLMMSLWLFRFTSLALDQLPIISPSCQEAFHIKDKADSRFQPANQRCHCKVKPSLIG